MKKKQKADPSSRCCYYGGVVLSGKKTWAWLGLCVLFLLVVHFSFMLYGFGETDACELGNMVLQLQKTGTLQHYSYAIRISVLYLRFWVWALDMGVTPVHLPQMMNILNVMVSSFLTIPLYFFWLKIADTKTAIIALIILNFAPGFWIGSIYGMPHIPAMAFFILSLLSFTGYLDIPNRKRYLCLLAAGIFGILTVGFKADLILGFGVYFFLVYRTYGWMNRHWLSAIMATGMPILFTVTVPQMMYPELTAFNKFALGWQQSFPFTVNSLVDVKNITSTICCLGIVVSFATLLLWIIGLKKKIRLDLLVFVLIWSVPLFAFWALRMGNSARHMVLPMIGFLFYAIVVLCRIVHSERILAGILVVLIGMNYFLCPDMFLSRTYRPSSKIFQSPKYLQDNVSCWHRLGRIIADSHAEKKIIFGSDYCSYALWEILCRQQQFAIDKQSGCFTFNDGVKNIQVQKKIFNGPEMTELQRANAVAAYPSWEIWEWDYLDNNTKWEVNLLHTP